MFEIKKILFGGLPIAIALVSATVCAQALEPDPKSTGRPGTLTPTHGEHPNDVTASFAMHRSRVYKITAQARGRGRELVRQK
ncbi:hypothetical protein OKW50_008223 [Paraburkholderia youngii]